MQAARPYRVNAVVASMSVSSGMSASITYWTSSGCASSSMPDVRISVRMLARWLVWWRRMLNARQQMSTNSWKLGLICSPLLMTYAMSGVSTNGVRSLCTAGKTRQRERQHMAQTTLKIRTRPKSRVCRPQTIIFKACQWATFLFEPSKFTHSLQDILNY